MIEGRNIIVTLRHATPSPLDARHSEAHQLPPILFPETVAGKAARVAFIGKLAIRNCSNIEVEINGKRELAREKLVGEMRQVFCGGLELVDCQ